MDKIKAAIKKVPLLATTYRNVRDRWIANKEAVVTPFGYKFIGNKDMQSGNFERGDVEIFRKILGNVDVVVDAGAHVGYYCLHALDLKKHLIAFEPFPLNAKMLLKNIFINGWGDDAEVFQLALAQKPGIAEMYGGGTGASLIKGWAGFSPRKPSLVPVSSLDVVLGDRLARSRTLVLIDVEGAEYELLQGARKLFDSESKPVWMIEITLLGHRPEGQTINPNFIPTLELFWQRGYDVYARDGNGKVGLVAEKDIRTNPEKILQSIFSNFIFVHRTSDQIKQCLREL